MRKRENIPYPLQAERFLAQREKHGYTQKDVCRIINRDLKTYRTWEHGKERPNCTDLIKLADLYSVSTDYLLGLLEEKTHDLHFIHEEIGLSEIAIEILKENKTAIFFHYDSKTDYESFADAVSSIIQHEKFRAFVYRLLQSRALPCVVTTPKEEIEEAYATVKKSGYAILAPGENNRISLDDAKQIIAEIISDSFGFYEHGYLELRT